MPRKEISNYRNRIRASPFLISIRSLLCFPPPIDVTTTKEEGAACLQQTQQPIRIGVPDESQTELRWVNRKHRKQQVWYTSQYVDWRWMKGIFTKKADVFIDSYWKLFKDNNNDLVG